MAVVLIIDDDANMRWALEKALKKEGLKTITEEDGTAGLQAVTEKMPDLVLCDLKMPGMDGLELLGKIKEATPGLPVIMITGYGTVETAVQAMKLGADDFILKPFDIDAVRLAVKKALGVEKLRDEVRFWRQEALQPGAPSGLVGSSEVMQRLLVLIRQVAATPATVLITGESGTGKELVAQAIHETSLRKDQPLIKVNCGAIPETLLESELFGHEKGAFTGANARKPGRFERADQGTIFLDEVGEMSPAVQVKLLRVLQEKEIERVGGTDVIKIDVRVIAATNRDLAADVKSGRFREDLYYRLNVFPLAVPPLRERLQDIPQLAVFFVDRYSGEFGKGKIEIADEAMRLLSLYSWPGNVRELQNVIERAVILSTQQVILPEQLPIEILRSEVYAEKPGLAGDSVTLPENGLDLETVERSLLEQALEKASGNQTRAAKLLGISRHTLIYRMEKYGLK
ncbi:MAG: sigma-54-dependent transcriptional regulator [Candidatus Saccharibacteria bacterium]